MTNLFVKRRFCFLLISLFLIMLSIAPQNVSGAESDSTFWVEYIDVGQGDCALIQCDGHYMMIDGGPSKASSTVFSILKDKGINNIDLMIASHPDEDHIGGLSGALNYATVGTVLSPVKSHDTKTFNSLLKYIQKQGRDITVPQNGDVYKLGSAKIYIAGPINSSSDTNNESIVVKVVYGSNSFMFMGDAEEEEEKSILAKYSGLECDVIKIGHHGSAGSTTLGLLEATKPTYAVISVGKNNTYGHPTQKVMNRLADAKIQVYRTDLQGDIIFYSDGKKLTVQTQKNTSQVEPSKNDDGTAYGAINDGNDVAIPAGTKYVLNTNTKKFHYPSCSSVTEMRSKNRRDVNVTRDEIIAQGYNPCKRCNP